ncbi:MAG TPA: hypothetical protein VFJ95_07505, partial [Gammaproteobacteria bacterium]|nr:hypothetical protein [Gammaproteobacteria bacterium]
GRFPRRGAFARAQNAVVRLFVDQLKRRAAALWVLRCAPHPGALRAPGLLRLSALWLGSSLTPLRSTFEIRPQPLPSCTRPK